MTEETIRKEFIKGYDCSQVVLRAFADKLGLKMRQTEWQRALAAE